MAAKLTKVQATKLQRIQDGYTLHYGGQKLLSKLRSLGLVAAVWSEQDGLRLSLTDAGRTALSQHQGGADG